MHCSSSKHRVDHARQSATSQASRSVNMNRIFDCRFKENLQLLTSVVSGFGGLRVSVLAFSTQVRGFKPDRSRRIFKGEKMLSTPSFGGEVKPSVPCRRFAACKKSLNVAWKSTFRQNYRTFPPFATRVVYASGPACAEENICP